MNVIARKAFAKLGNFPNRHLSQIPDNGNPFRKKIQKDKVPYAIRREPRKTLKHVKATIAEMRLLQK